MLNLHILLHRREAGSADCCFCRFYYRGMSGDQTTLTLGQCRQPVTYAYHTFDLVML